MESDTLVGEQHKGNMLLFNGATLTLNIINIVIIPGTHLVPVVEILENMFMFFVIDRYSFFQADYF